MTFELKMNAVAIREVLLRLKKATEDFLNMNGALLSECIEKSKILEKVEKELENLQTKRKELLAYSRT